MHPKVPLLHSKGPRAKNTSTGIKGRYSFWNTTRVGESQRITCLVRSYIFFYCIVVHTLHTCISSTPKHSNTNAYICAKQVHFFFFFFFLIALLFPLNTHTTFVPPTLPYCRSWFVHIFFFYCMVVHTLHTCISSTPKHSNTNAYICAKQVHFFFFFFFLIALLFPLNTHTTFVPPTLPYCRGGRLVEQK